MLRILPLRYAPSDCGRHVFRVRAFNPVTGTMVHICIRCGAEKRDRAHFMRHDRLDLYSRWAV